MKILPVALAVCLTAALTAAAQDDAPPSLGVPRIVTRPVAAQPAARNNAAPPSGSAIAVEEALADYGRMIGKKILCDVTVQGMVPVVADRASISNENAAELMEKSFFLNGFTLMDVSDDAVAVLGLGRPVRDFGIPLYTELEEIPHAERTFSYLFKLQHRDPLEIQAFLQQYIPPTNTISFNADPKSQTLVATAQTSIIRTVIRLIAALDVPPVADKDVPPPPLRRSRENLPAPPKILKPPQPVPNEGGDQ